MSHQMYKNDSQGEFAEGEGNHQPIYLLKINNCQQKAKQLKNIIEKVEIPTPYR